MAQDLDPNGARRLLLALLLRAVKDTQRGDLEARDWLAGAGAELADDLDIAHPDVVRAWAAYPGARGADPSEP